MISATAGSLRWTRNRLLARLDGGLTPIFWPPPFVPSLRLSPAYRRRFARRDTSSADVAIRRREVSSPPTPSGLHRRPGVPPCSLGGSTLGAGALPPPWHAHGCAHAAGAACPWWPPQPAGYPLGRVPRRGLRLDASPRASAAPRFAHLDALRRCALNAHVCAHRMMYLCASDGVQ